jgi:adenylate kinase
MEESEKINDIKNWVGTGSINIFGRPLAGKDTQGRRLAEILDGNVIGGGEILRGSTIPDHTKECMRAGKLIPSDDYVNIVLPYLNQPRLASKPLILSSVGRWHGEEEGVTRATDASGHPLKAVIYLALSDDDVYNRWRAIEANKDRDDRLDDAEEILATRLAEFREKTLPVIDYYRNLNMLIEIDGRRTRDEVASDILDTLYEHC